MFDKKDIAALQALADRVADRYGIPRHLFRDYITYCSNWDPDSELEEYDFAGLGHLDSDVSRVLGLVVNDRIDERFDPEKNLDATARFLLGAVELYTRDREAWDAGMKAAAQAENGCSVERKYH